VPDAKAITPEALAEIVEATGKAKKRLIVVAADPAAAQAWAKYRGVKRQWYFAEDDSLLYGIEDRPDSVDVVLVKGYASHRRWTRLKRRLALVGAAGVNIHIDELPPEATPPGPTVGGAYVAHREVAQLRPDKDQGDTFIIRSTTDEVVLTRPQAEMLTELLTAYVEGEHVADESLARFDEIVARVRETGDIYGRQRG
jgi:hypothetical protein